MTGEASDAMEKNMLGPADIRILECLSEDARSPVAKIADRLRMPESTVRHRLNLLVQKGYVHFAAVTDPLKFGYQIWTVIEIQVEPSKIRAVAQRLAKAPELYLVLITTGTYDIMVAGAFRSNQEVLEFTTGRLARMPGIVRTSTSIILEGVKRSMTFGVQLSKVHVSNGAVARRTGRRRAQPNREESI